MYLASFNCYPYPTDTQINFHAIKVLVVGPAGPLTVVSQTKPLHVIYLI